MNQPFDFVESLEKDMSIKIIACLDDPCDLARALCVSKSWHRLVIENELCKHLCLKLCPDTSKIIDVVEPIDNNPQPDTGFQNHRVFSLLLRGITSFPSDFQIKESVCASSTDRFPEERVHNTLESNNIARELAYWSSKGSSDPIVPESLVYKLVSNFCLVSEIHVKPLRAFWERGRPVYSPEAIRFCMGHRRSSLKHKIRYHSATNSYIDEMFMWTYTSPVFPMTQAAGVQRFQLPRPALCIGGILKMELLGRVHKNHIDGLYYVCVDKVQAVGRDLSPVFDIDVQEDTGLCILKHVYRHNDMKSHARSS